MSNLNQNRQNQNQRLNRQAKKSVPMAAGKPKGAEGYFFSIYNYRTIRFRIPNLSDTDHFTEAVVYVFSKEGDLVLEKQFTVSVKS